MASYELCYDCRFIFNSLMLSNSLCKYFSCHEKSIILGKVEERKKRITTGKMNGVSNNEWTPERPRRPGRDNSSWRKDGRFYNSACLLVSPREEGRYPLSISVWVWQHLIIVIKVRIVWFWKSRICNTYYCINIP